MILETDELRADKGSYYSLLIPVPLRNIASCRGTLATPAIEDELLLRCRLRKSVSSGPFAIAQLERARQLCQWYIDCRRDHPLHDLVFLPHIDEEGILQLASETRSMTSREVHTDVGWRVRGLSCS